MRRSTSTQESCIYTDEEQCRGEKSKTPHKDDPKGGKSQVSLPTKQNIRVTVSVPVQQVKPNVKKTVNSPAPEINQSTWPSLTEANNMPTREIERGVRHIPRYQRGTRASRRKEQDRSRNSSQSSTNTSRNEDVDFEIIYERVFRNEYYENPNSF